VYGETATVAETLGAIWEPSILFLLSAYFCIVSRYTRAHARAFVLIGAAASITGIHLWAGCLQRFPCVHVIGAGPPSAPAHPGSNYR